MISKPNQQRSLSETQTVKGLASITLPVMVKPTCNKQVWSLSRTKDL